MYLYSLWNEYKYHVIFLFIMILYILLGIFHFQIIRLLTPANIKTFDYMTLLAIQITQNVHQPVFYILTGMFLPLFLSLDILALFIHF